MNNLRLKFINNAKEIFEQNTFSGFSLWHKSTFSFIAPADFEYTFQFLWDTAFHAIVLNQFDATKAKQEIESHLSQQGIDGFIPHVIWWGPQKVLPYWAYIESKLSLRAKTTAITQPPIFATAIEKIITNDHDLKFLRRVLPKLDLYHQWLINNRDPDSDHLLSIISPNESGMDESPVFQTSQGYTGNNNFMLRWIYRKGDLLNLFLNYNLPKIFRSNHFNVEELVFNCVFAESCRSLSRLYSLIKDSEKSKKYEKIAVHTEQAIITKCWDEKTNLFYSLSGKNEQQVQVNTIASIIPLYLTGLPKKYVKALIHHLTDPQEYWTQFPVPTVAKNEKYYNPEHAKESFWKMKLLWRGPTWINMNWFIVEGLRKHGYNKLANTLVDKTIELLQKSNFREYYNPETGEGYRRENFGWSTLIIDMMK